MLTTIRESSFRSRAQWHARAARRWVWSLTPGRTPTIIVLSKFVLLLVLVLGCDVCTAADRLTETFAITAKPRFEHGALVNLILADTKRSCTIIWGIPPDVQYVPVSLDTNRVYTFLVERKAFPEYNFTNSALRKIQLAGQTIYEIEGCEVHHARMELKEVSIMYGLVIPGPGAPSADSERRLFPHRREVSFGGCVSMPDSPKTEQVYVCARCKKAYGKWMADQQRSK